MIESVQDQVRTRAIAHGFAIAGIAPLPRLGSADASTREDYFRDWIAQGHAGEMEYLKRQDALGRYLRSAVEVAVPWARSIVVCAAPYGGGPEHPLSTDPAPAGTGWIGRYAWSGRQAADGQLAPSDYHKVLLRRLKALEADLKESLGSLDDAGAEGFQSWAYVDTGPMIERAFSAMAGVGWTGKNVCTLNQELGSFFFLGVILLSTELAPEQRAELPADRCGSCTRCLDACPTDALVAPHQMNASRCIAYLTIEKRGSIDPALRAGMGRQIFGCDICQDVCPWNHRARRGAQPLTLVKDTELVPRALLINPSLAAMAALSEPEWEKLFFGSPVKRARYSGFRRNVAIAMGNSGDPALLPQLELLAAQEQDETLRETALWAIDRLHTLQGEPSSGRRLSLPHDHTAK
ncbi:tRNA epoxyqueuosine(34) reductase QueG [Acidipila sp. EB88]|uniref:tRNA epoxyqueuosine(34) reductase QueG n=1 Tax=Acidipila sp. EB88 TaxID=2305226 RepID=UPI000F5D6AEB|nr:tRNA epoxyqueuosine(34) reductase QueG [Acidipila sp. EB88]RRA49110.1 tRNA epoxyqueuosine(34) reductase QueG [Acidipila sp. EB88]